MKKIDFKCKKITIRDIIQCNYNLTDSEYLVFEIILNSKKKGLSVKDITEKSNKQRTSIQKIISKLLKKDLIFKKQINLDRGYMYIYQVKEKDKIISEIENNVETYYNSLKRVIDNWKKKKE